jgi:ribosomal protein L32
LGIYRVHDQTKAQFVANAVQVEMQCHHFYIAHHATKATNATATYRAKHEIVDIDMG